MAVSAPRQGRGRRAVYAVVLALHILVSIFLILVVLLQTGKGGDIASAFGGSGSQAVFGPRGASNVLSKATTWSAVVFMLTSLGLFFLSQPGGSSVMESAPEPVPVETPAAPEVPEQAPAGEAPSDQGGTPAAESPAEGETAPAGQPEQAPAPGE
ncbi:MAG: preprotein translocase subunit SecG [Acidobacteria bacterium]|nr:MAG: preprotein translocase subunit SecG [Acidobacteriota bacterium]